MTLPGQLWRSGETVLNHIHFDVNTDLPEDEALFVKLGMYTQDGSITINGPDALQPMDYQIIQLQGFGHHNIYFDDFYTLDTLSHVKQQKQGAPLEVDVTWLINDNTKIIPQLNFNLYADSGELKFATNMPLTNNTKILMLTANSYITERYVLPIPTTLQPGKYKLAISLSYDGIIPNRNSFSSSIEITRRERNFDVPDMAYTLNETFGNLIHLVGYDLEEDDNNLTIALHWQSINDVEDDYKYFVHIIRGNQIYAQIDTMPNNNQYPTSWWAPNEIITDRISLNTTDLIPGDYNVTVGLYSPIDASRLTTAGNKPNSSNTDYLTIHKLNITP
jgi:hypothetical protein